jgi:hypothetical protein
MPRPAFAFWQLPPAGQIVKLERFRASDDLMTFLRNRSSAVGTDTRLVREASPRRIS